MTRAEKEVLAERELKIIRAEWLLGAQNNPSIQSAAEAYALTLFELDLFGEQARKAAKYRDPEVVKTQLRKIAASALRTLIDIC